MSTSKRIISGTIASWARIGVTIVTQIALVPLFLNYWDLKTYGYWIAIQAFINIVSMFDRSYVDYLGYEFMKIGKENNKIIGIKLSSGIKVIIITGVIQTVFLSLFVFSDYFGYILGNNVNSNVLHECSWVLILNWISWAFCANTTGLYFRGLTVFGYFPRMAWWDTLIAFLNAAISSIIVSIGGDLFQVSIGTTFLLFFLTLFRFIDIYRLSKKHNILDSSGSIRKGFVIYGFSLGLSLKFFLETFRQQGVRIIISPLIGVENLTKFSTVKTLSNISQQSLLTITNPILPELMRFVNQKQQTKINEIFTIIWLFVVLALCNGIVILQFYFAELFDFWTRGKVKIDPLLFSFLSSSVLFYAYSQPAMSILNGNNLVKQQIKLNAYSTLALLILLMVITPKLQINGVGLSVLFAEAGAAMFSVFLAKKWLEENNILWQKKQSILVFIGIINSTVMVVCMSLFPEYILYIFVLYCVILIYIIYKYWKNVSYIYKKYVYEKCSFRYL